MCYRCQVLYINGHKCHETGCPDAWRDRLVECEECGCDFVPESRRQTICEGCMQTENECEINAMEEYEEGEANALY